ncbi:MAG: hypothetical protein AAGJ46_06325 [Planctomycetota bacterium]
MSLAARIQNQLAQSGIDGAVLRAAEDGESLLVRVDQAGPLAVSCWELRLETGRLAGASIETVKQVAEEVTRRVTYLLEPIQPIEADSEACVIQLRSTKPDESADSRTYYECLVKTGGSIALQRYEAPRGQLRHAVAMNLTHELVGRLTDDFVASVG